MTARLLLTNWLLPDRKGEGVMCRRICLHALGERDESGTAAFIHDSRHSTRALLQCPVDLRWVGHVFTVVACQWLPEANPPANPPCLLIQALSYIPIQAACPLPSHRSPVALRLSGVADSQAPAPKRRRLQQPTWRRCVQCTVEPLEQRFPSPPTPAESKACAGAAKGDPAGRPVSAPTDKIQSPAPTASGGQSTQLLALPSLDQEGGPTLWGTEVAAPSSTTPAPMAADPMAPGRQPTLLCEVSLAEDAESSPRDEEPAPSDWEEVHLRMQEQCATHNTMGDGACGAAAALFQYPPHPTPPPCCTPVPPVHPSPPPLSPLRDRVREALQQQPSLTGGWKSLGQCMRFLRKQTGTTGFLALAEAVVPVLQECAICEVHGTEVMVRLRLHTTPPCSTDPNPWLPPPPPTGSVCTRLPL
eukprot:GGOE01023656.1.p1 GENE.GGOE01023656.1~~GGOE01023656.1.p1  ORF type:complete len:426 (-),score=32.53 GGOE01023656.1:210-1460(-)